MESIVSYNMVEYRAAHIESLKLARVQRAGTRGQDNIYRERHMKRASSRHVINVLDRGAKPNEPPHLSHFLFSISQLIPLWNK
jgi:hypothetical protein